MDLSHLSEAQIKDVTDTAVWVAAYRASESQRPDALFKDDYAKLLVGDEGQLIALHTQGSRYTAWSVVIRTYIIDQFLQELLKSGVDTVINLGAGLDTRPYRMNLNPDLKWIEVDFPNIINLKNEKLKEAKPKCQLTRLALDLSDEATREEFFNQAAGESQNAIIMTEGVVPYLTNEEARSLAGSLFKRDSFKYWITEYYSPEILKFLRTPKRLKQMENSPFLFYTENWFEFFRESGWNEDQTKYFGEESQKLGRTPPTPGWMKQINDESIKESVKRYLGYSIYKKNETASIK